MVQNLGQDFWKRGDVNRRQRRLSLQQIHRRHGHAECHLNPGWGREQRPDCCSRRVPLTQPHSQVQSAGLSWIQTQHPDVSEKCQLPNVTSETLYKLGTLVRCSSGTTRSISPSGVPQLAAACQCKFTCPHQTNSCSGTIPLARVQPDKADSGRDTGSNSDM